MCSCFCIEDVYCSYILLTIAYYVLLYPLHKLDTITLKNIFTTFLFGFLLQTHEVIRLMNYLDVKWTYRWSEVMIRCIHIPFQGTGLCRAEWSILLSKIYNFYRISHFGSPYCTFLGRNSEEPCNPFLELRSTVIHYSLPKWPIKYFLHALIFRYSIYGWWLPIQVLLKMVRYLYMARIFRGWAWFLRI